MSFLNPLPNRQINCRKCLATDKMWNIWGLLADINSYQRLCMEELKSEPDNVVFSDCIVMLSILN
jgi:hypothetical protein